VYTRTPEAPWIPRSSFGGVAVSNLPRPMPLSGTVGDPATPLVVGIRFHRSDATHKDNGCYHCPLNLGFSTDWRVTIEWEIELDGHLPGFEYAVGGFRSSSSWERVVVRRKVGLVRLEEVWRRRELHSRVPEEAWSPLASLTPVRNRIFVVHYSVFPKDLLSRYTKDLVHRQSIFWMVKARNPSQGTDWQNITPATNILVWHSIAWIVRGGKGKWVLETPWSRIAKGPISLDVLDSPPKAGQ
jgi:hypothetical protein